MSLVTYLFPRLSLNITVTNRQSITLIYRLRITPNRISSINSKKQLAVELLF